MQNLLLDCKKIFITFSLLTLIKLVGAESAGIVVEVLEGLMQSSVMAASAWCIRNAVALRDACYVRVSSRVPDVLGRQGLLMEDTP